MIVAWSEKRWPGFIHMLLRLVHAKAADQGALRIRLDEPAALGRMVLEDREENVLCALIDSSRTREKWFYLPVDTAEAGMVLKNEAGEVLFSWAAGSAYDPGRRGQPDAGKPSADAPSEGRRAPYPAPEETAPPQAASSREEADETRPPPADTGQDKAAQEATIPENEPRTAEQKAPQPDEASGLEIKKGETET